MAHPLNGARLKVCRAEEHLQALKESIADYVASVPYELAAEDDGETVNLVLTLISHPDPTIGAVIGDCLHNLRSALDYLMWELAGTYVNRRLEPPPDGKDRVYFPICGTAGAFQKNASTLAKYKIPGAVLSELEAVQPYQGGFESLEKLRNLTNVDKHRLPLLVCAAINGMVFDFGEIAALTRGTKVPQESMRSNVALRSVARPVNAKRVGGCAALEDARLCAERPPPLRSIRALILDGGGANGEGRDVFSFGHISPFSGAADNSPARRGGSLRPTNKCWVS